MPREFKTVDGQTLVEVVDDVNNKRNKKNKQKRDLLDREPMIVTASVTTVAISAADGILAACGAAPGICAGLSMIGFFGTMVCKGSRDSKYCIILAVINLITAVCFLVAQLKLMGIFDWLQFEM